MTTHVMINSLGLLADITGAVLVWRFGLPETVSRSGSQFLILEQRDEQEAAKAKRYDSLAKLGIGCLVGGFALQLVSNFL